MARQDSTTGASTPANETSYNHPAWNEILAVIPAMAFYRDIWSDVYISLSKGSSRPYHRIRAKMVGLNLNPQRTCLEMFHNSPYTPAPLNDLQTSPVIDHSTSADCESYDFSNLFLTFSKHDRSGHTQQYVKPIAHQLHFFDSRPHNCLSRLMSAYITTTKSQSRLRSTRGSMCSRICWSSAKTLGFKHRTYF